MYTCFQHKQIQTTEICFEYFFVQMTKNKENYIQNFTVLVDSFLQYKVNTLNISLLVIEPFKGTQNVFHQ